ncbi:MAG: hypothetical protein AAGD06_31275 [Acidobacteriota bacterium]
MKYNPVAAPLLLLALLLLTAGPSLASFEPAPCDEVATWVEQHQDLLPKTLADFTVVPSGYQVGVFNTLEPELRQELWVAFLGDYVDARAEELTDEQRQQILAFEGRFSASPQAAEELDGASQRVLTDLLASFTLRLADPIAEQVALDGLDGIAVAGLCTCNRALDYGCMAMFCTFTQSGCGPDTTAPCTGVFAD